MKKRADIIFSNIYDRILSAETKLKLEKVVFFIALAGFFVHLLAIWIVKLGALDVGGSMQGLQEPMDAIYTPFSIILFYEVYCLIYYLPKSLTIYIGKQFEIITLITIRGIFAEMSNLTISSDVQQMYSDPQFLYTMATILILFFLIYIFYSQNQKTIRVDKNTGGVPARSSESEIKYIFAKKVLALLLGLLFLVLILVNLYQWLFHDNTLIHFLQNTRPATKGFFSSFFLVLILTDVLVLLFSFAITDQFPKVMRNSGFVVSTTLIKLSFNVEGVASHLLVIMSVVFGTLMLMIYKKYRNIELPVE